MVVDTSALVAILLQEDDAPRFTAALAAADAPVISAATFAEAGIVIGLRRGLEGERDLDRLLSKAGIEVVPVDAEQAELARGAYRRFGKGLHPAGLNFGDCFAYALASARALPLLFKGDDFRQTDIEAAV